MNRFPPVMVVIPHWNRKEELSRCLRSLAWQSRLHQVVVIDNASTDASGEMLAAEFPRVRLYRCQSNLGFAGATNIGLRLAIAAGAEYVLLLNNDTVAHPRLIEHLVEFARQDARRGIVAPSVYYLDRPTRLWSSGGEIDLTRCACHQLAAEGKKPRQVDYASGCALLVASRLIQHVGLLDPRFFMYFEEVDWCLRARRAGFEIWHLPQAKVWHEVSATLGEKSPALHYYMARNRLLLLQKNRGSLAALRVLTGEYLRALAVARWRKDRARSRALRLAMADFVSQRFGEKPSAALVGG